MTIKDLNPALVWNIFDQITKVPRPSKKEEKIREYLVNFAKEHGIEYKTDAIGNVAMFRPATKGYENAPRVILQGHMDMVCVANDGVEHDFDNDPIKMGSRRRHHPWRRQRHWRCCRFGCND